MKRIIQLSHKLFLIIVTLFLSSCGENFALKEETIYFQEKNLGWLSEDVRGDHFVMTENNGISSSFTMERNSYELSKSWSSFLGVNTHMTFREYQYQNYSSSYGTSFSISLTAGYVPHGDVIYVTLAGVDFGYDIKFKELTRLSVGEYYYSKNITEDGYEESGTPTFSTVEILANYSTGNSDYDTVLFFQLKDFEDAWNDFTPEKIYIAKNVGLISYELKTGIIYERVD